MAASPRSLMSVTRPSSTFARSCGRSSMSAVLRNSSVPLSGFWRPPRRSLLLIGVRANVMPELIDFIVAEHAFPWRHLVFAVADRIVKTRAFVRLQPAQVEGLATIDQLVAMADCAARVVDGFAGVDLVLVGCGVLGQGVGCAAADREKHDGD